MSVFLSKLLSLFIHPLSLGLLLIASGTGLVIWWRQVGLGLLVFGLFVLWIPSTPIVSETLRGPLERQYPPESVEAVPEADAIVTLGGSISPPLPPRVYPDLNAASDRIWHAARLYRANKAPIVVASGGTLPWRDQTFREAPVMQMLLASFGVPADSVLLESESANTYENARRTAELLKKRDADRVLLVTSALHMRRALATFRAAGVHAIPAATDHQVVDRTSSLLDWLPSAGALGESTAAIREYVGYWVYDWRGWIADSRSYEEGEDGFKGAFA